MFQALDVAGCVAAVEADGERDALAALVEAWDGWCNYAIGDPDQGANVKWVVPEEGSDLLAAECVALFCRWLGSFAGDLALTFRARSVCLAGGLTGHLDRYLRQGGFIQRFLDKGVLSDTLREVPVFTIEHGQLGLIGAAAWHAAQPSA